MLILVLLGAPGAGKGTQASHISEVFKIPHISTGDIFRVNIREQTQLGKKAQTFIDKGKLCPDDITIELVRQRIIKDDCINGFILDGFPRTIVQAKFLDETLNANKLMLDAAVNIDVTDNSIIDRMSGRRVCTDCGATYHILFNKPKIDSLCDECGSRIAQRADDGELTVRKRLTAYHKKTAPLIDYYKDMGKLIQVDGSVGIEETAKGLISKLRKFGGFNDLPKE